MLSAEQAGWKLMDLMAAGNTHGALTFAKELMYRGESPYGLWNRMTWVIAQLTIVTACVQDGDANPASIAKTAGVPFPTARTLVPLAKKIDSQKLAHIVEKFTDADIALKTGGYRSTVDATDEVTALIDSCILCIS
jgi:DNA polymerase III delta subunit